MIYNLIKNLINGGKYEKQDMLDKLDVFLMFDRITLEQYQELVELMENKEVA